ncbi:MaoC family dehydratase [Oceanobacillus rekensis]|uniref:MaoC family dehydratase n=1 Tax=Oceanobacillus rekensis TaxID=937927 RepID=UPI000B4535F8|nr:MaoC family dehydratase [Oceanobacillus rekensis]
MNLQAFFPKTIMIPITDKMVENYAKVSQDLNPIHMSIDAAQQAGFPQKVVHGMLTMAISTRLVSPLLGRTQMIQSYQMKLIAPVYVNDQLTVTGSVLSSNEIKILGENQNGKIVIKGNMRFR